MKERAQAGTSRPLRRFSLDGTRKSRAAQMFHVVENSASFRPNFEAAVAHSVAVREFENSFLPFEDLSSTDIDVVDDSLLNTAPHNVIERQLLTGDVVGLALMSSAILWSAMGAFG